MTERQTRKSSEEQPQRGAPTEAARSGEQRPDQERELRVSREQGRDTGAGSGVQRGGARPGGAPLAGRGQAQPSVLPALMSNPWLMTNAFMNNPFGFTQALSQEMDRLFASGGSDVAPIAPAGRAAGRGLGAQGGHLGGSTPWAPQVEVRQRGNELVVSADLPGLKPDDVDIEIDDGVLTISGERRSSTDDRQEGLFRTERSYGAFARSIALPDGVDEDKVKARFEHGVLEVTVPLPEQRPRGRRVQIQAAGEQPSAKPKGDAPPPPSGEARGSRNAP